MITDCDHVVTASGTGKKEYEGKPISKQLEDAISERKNFLASRNDAEFVKVTLDDAGEFGQQALSTIICEGDAIGAVILYEKDEKSRMTETESKLAIATCYWPMFEVDHGKWKLTYEPKKKLPIEDFLRPQGRFKHLFKKGNEDLIVQFQEEVDRRWEDLLYKCAR